MNTKEMEKLKLTKPERCYHGLLYGMQAWCDGYMLTCISNRIMLSAMARTDQRDGMQFDHYVPYDADMELTVWGVENWFKDQYYAVLADKAGNIYLANAHYIAHFLRCYLKPQFYTGPDPYSPIIVKVVGDVVGLVMPLASTGYPMPENVANYLKIDYPGLTYDPAMFDPGRPPLERIAATKRM